MRRPVADVLYSRAMYGPRTRAAILMLVGWLAALTALPGCTPPPQDLGRVPLRLTRHGATALVVVYSRSGSTATMGLELARLLGADYLRIVGPKGAGNSLFSTPNRHERVPIKPGRIDLSRYRLVLLGTPIWYWRPSAMIYNFVKSNRFDGKKVVLFFTYRGGISSNARGEWSDLVRWRGGEVIDFFGINTKKLQSRTIESWVRERTRGRSWSPRKPARIRIFQWMPQRV